MNIAAVIAIVASATAFLVAVLCLAFASAPRWREQRWFAVVAATTCVYAACDAIAAAATSHSLVIWASRVSLSMVGFHWLGWLRLIAAQAGRRNTRFENGVAVAAIAASGLALVPGLVMGDQVGSHAVPAFGVVYTDARPTAFGTVLYGFFFVTLIVPWVHYVRAWRRGVPDSRPPVVALTVILVAAANDTFANLGLTKSPYLLEIGFIVVVVVVGGVLVKRFLASTRELDALSASLEREVDERTRELAAAQDELARMEKLAAVGRLAAGVAHEINNPAAAVVANLQYLKDCWESGELPPDVNACIDESSTAMDRIARIVRQLLSAGRVAGRKQSIESVDLHEAIANAVASSRAACGEDIAVAIDVARDVVVTADLVMLEQILVNLLVNAAQAIHEVRASGRIEVTCKVEGERATVLVADDGCGIGPQAQRKLFEPFFTTKPQGKGTGLGLAVSAGIAQALGGRLRLERTSPRGTVMALDLRVADTPSVKLAKSAPLRTRRLRALVVDDEEAVRHALARLLSPSYEIDTADGVMSALARVDTRTFDFVLCDVTMPGGGAERLFETLSVVAPGLATTTIFLTGGATSARSSAFIDAHADRVLYKPLDVELLHALVTRVVIST